MSWLELFHLSQVTYDYEGIEKFEKLIIDSAINYGIITPSDEKDFSSDEGIRSIIELAYERCFHK